MKVIDLLVKIANGEEVPRKFKYEDITYIYNNELGEYFDKEGNSFNFTFDLTDYDVLTDELEIIEDTPKEDKKIEKISLDDYVEFTTSGDIQRLDYMFNKNTNTFVDKINEIIDKINGE